MNKQPQHIQAEQDKLSQLYQALKQEQPSLQVDHNILALAQLQCKSAESKTSQQSALQHSNKGHWRQWQWPVSIAASVLLVSVIFVDQYPIFTDSQAIYSDQVPLEIEAFSVPAPPPSLPDNAATMQQDSKNEQRARPAVSEQSTQAEQHSAYLVAKREAQQRAEAETSQRKQQVEQHQKAAQDYAVQHAQNDIATTKIARSAPADLDEAVNSQIEYLQSELASKQAILATINNKLSKLLVDSALALQSETSVSLTLAEQQELEQQIADLQNQLIKQISNKQRIDAKWQAPQKLLDLLSAEQQAQWLQPVGDANHDKQENKQ